MEQELVKEKKKEYTDIEKRRDLEIIKLITKVAELKNKLPELTKVVEDFHELHLK